MDNLLQCENLSKSFHLGPAIVPAVDSVSFSLKKGEILGIVGESGSGKSTLGKMLIGLVRPDEGKILIHHKPLNHFNRKNLAFKIQMIFQDWQSSLDPRFNISKILTESWLIHNLYKTQDDQNRLDNLLDLVQLPKDVLSRTPRQLSGGQLQRVVIARALSLNPEILIADEPTSSLDIPLRHQILDLFLSMKQNLHLTMIVISHDLEAVTRLADHIFVMFRGKFVEYGTPDHITHTPFHPYTLRLTHPDESALLDPSWEEINNSFQWNHHCPFHPLCIHQNESCRKTKPYWKNLEKEHWVLCK